MNISKLFSTIRTTSGSNDKMKLLNDNMNETIKLIFNDCFNKQQMYNVKKFNEELPFGNKNIDEDYGIFHDMLMRLNAREITGNAAIDLVESTISSFNEESQSILCDIIKRKLKIGISTTSLNKLLGVEAQKDFEVTLAYNIDKVKGVNPIDGTYFASRKIDGVRDLNIVSKQNGKCSIKFLSRQNKEYTTLNNIIPALEWLVRDLSDGVYVFDGELCIVDENGDEHFDWVMKEIKRKDYTIPNPRYQIFDFCTIEEFNGEKTSPVFNERYAILNKLFEGNTFNTIRLLKQERITSQDDFDRWTKYAEDGNWEGFMLRKDVPFETGRTKNLLKVKKFDDLEAIVKDVEISEMTTAEPGKGNITFTGIKSLLIEYKGSIVHVGSGLSKEQRIEWYKDTNKIIGKTICIKYFEETINQDGGYSLRFPILKYVYDNGRDC